jgi:uncharacterized protein
MNTERRTTLHKVEVRAEGGKRKIVGYGAVFNSLSENLGGFREIIAPDAFNGVLNDPHTRGLYNHSSDMVLGRNGTTMKLSVDDTGLKYEIDPPDTSYARDLLVSMERGDVDQSSFQFTVEQDSWDEDEEGRTIRTIEKIGRLIDVSPVTFPAYPDATSNVRDYLVAQQKYHELRSGDKTDESDQRLSELEQSLLEANETISAKDNLISKQAEQIETLKKLSE